MPKSSIPEKNNIDTNSYLLIDGERVGIDITLLNKSSKMPIPVDNFVGLEIEENINSPFYKGVLKIKNDNNRFDLIGSDTPNFKIEYNFLETGENFIVINLKRENKIKSYLLFVTEESNGIENNIKVKTFFVENAYFYLLKNNKIPFSTTELIKGDVTQLSDEQRQVNISNAIEKLLKNSIDEFIIDKDHWYLSKTKTNFSSSYNESALDSLNFLLDKALDNDDNFLFCLQRDNVFSLWSIKDMYDSYLTRNYENNFGGNFLLVSEEMPEESRKNVLTMRVTDYNIYNENPKHTLDNLVNHKVINYDFKGKKFNLLSKDNSFHNLKTYINKELLNDNTIINREENPKITNNTIYKPLYTTTSNIETARHEGRNIIFKNLINLSTMLSFRSQGVFEVNTGNFINVTYQTENENQRSNKLNGGWFVVGYKHTYTINSFSSEIVCTKFHELKL